MLDLQAIRTKEELVHIINNSGLPVSLLLYIIQDVEMLLERALQTQIDEQLKQEQEATTISDNSEEKTE